MDGSAVLKKLERRVGRNTSYSTVYRQVPRTVYTRSAANFGANSLLLEEGARKCARFLFWANPFERLDRQLRKRDGLGAAREQRSVGQLVRRRLKVCMPTMMVQLTHGLLLGERLPNHSNRGGPPVTRTSMATVPTRQPPGGAATVAPADAPPLPPHHYRSSSPPPAICRYKGFLELLDPDWATDTLSDDEVGAIHLLLARRRRHRRHTADADAAAANATNAGE